MKQEDRKKALPGLIKLDCLEQNNKQDLKQKDEAKKRK